MDAFLGRLAAAPNYPTQGVTLFVDLAQRTTRRAYTPRQVVETFLEGRGANMYYLYNLLDPADPDGPLSPRAPLIFGNGILTGIVPSAARGNCSGWSPETHFLMDSNVGDYFPSFLKLSGYDRLVITGRADRWTYLYVEGTKVEFRDATAWQGLDNLELRERVPRELGGVWARDLAMASITAAGERGVLSAGIMGGPKAIYARGGTGAKMGSLRLKAVVVRGFDPKFGFGADPQAVKPYNRDLAKQLLGTSVIAHALKKRGTPFLYRPSRILGAMGALNNQENTWVEALDAENIDPYRNQMAGCFRCPVNCRPMNDLAAAGQGRGDPYDVGDGPEYVTVGKFGPMVGIKDVTQMIRLNNIANDLGLDTASLGSSLSWAMELFQRGLIDEETTQGLKLEWGNAEVIEKLFFLTARREGFGHVIAHSSRAVDEGAYPREALRYRMAVKGLMQSDPHDARILKAFALGLAVATRGMDHLRNRVTLEINARINDDPEFKAKLYGGRVSGEPTSYEGKARAVRTCEDTFAVGDAVGMCRFTTQLFNSPSLPGLEEFSRQIKNVAGLELSATHLAQVGLNITGIERLINHALGARRQDDTLPARWFDEELKWGKYAGEKIDRAEFDKMLSEFYELSQLDDEGQPALYFRTKLCEVAKGFAISVRLPTPFAEAPNGSLVLTEPVQSVRELKRLLARAVPSLGALAQEEGFNVVVNDEMLLHKSDDTPLKSGDRIEIVFALSGG